MLPHHLTKTELPCISAVAYGHHAGSVLAFRDGYRTGYIIGALERRLGSLQELAPE